jgi:nitrogen-specific signal transduction histidine kinase
MIQNLLHNPLAMKMVLVTFLCVAVFLFTIYLLRRIRRGIAAQGDPVKIAQGNASFTLVAYEGLLRQLREKDQELQRLREQYKLETAASGNISEAVLTNLNCGVIFCDRMGIVRQANRAGKSLLGYASPLSFHIRDLFRGVTRIQWPDTNDEAHSSAPLVHALQEALRTAIPIPRMKLDYRTPSGQKRVLALTASAVKAKDGEILGVSCLLDDLTELAELSQELHRAESLASLGEISAGMVNDFKKSLATVRAHAQALLREDSDSTRRYYAEKIASELESVNRLIDEYLQFAASTKT